MNAVLDALRSMALHGPVTMEFLKDEAECDERTVRRHIDRLRTLGYAIVFERGTSRGWILDESACRPRVAIETIDRDAIIHAAYLLKIAADRGLLPPGQALASRAEFVNRLSNAERARLAELDRIRADDGGAGTPSRLPTT